MNTWKVILATLVIFVTGVVTGGLLVRYTGLGEKEPVVVAHGVSPSKPAPAPGSPGWVRIDFLRKMQKELGLTAEQRQQVDKLLKESQERTKKLMEPIAPSLHAEVQRAKEDFRGVLTPEQRAKFDELVKQQQKAKKTQPPRPAGVETNSLTNSVPTASTNS